MNSETTITTIAKGASLGGGSFAAGSAVVHYDFGMLCGIAIGVIGLAIQIALGIQKWASTRQSKLLEKEHAQREVEFHAARMQAMRAGIELTPRPDLRQHDRGEP